MHGSNMRAQTGTRLYKLNMLNTYFLLKKWLQIQDIVHNVYVAPEKR